MPADPQLHAIMTYLQTHRATHDRELLRQRLLHEGGPPALVDQAIVQVFGSPDLAELERMRSYLEQHRNTYDREALQRKLLSDGHAPQAIELAMVQVYGLTVAAADAPLDPGSSRGPFMVSLFGVLLLNFVAGCTLATIFFNSGLPTTSFLLMGALIPLQAALMAYFWRRNRPVARGFMWALIGSLPIVAMGLLLGFFIAVASSY